MIIKTRICPVLGLSLQEFLNRTAPDRTLSVGGSTIAPGSNWNNYNAEWGNQPPLRKIRISKPATPKRSVFRASKDYSLFCPISRFVEMRLNLFYFEKSPALGAMRALVQKLEQTPAMQNWQKSPSGSFVLILWLEMQQAQPLIARLRFSATQGGSFGQR